MPKAKTTKQEAPAEEASQEVNPLLADDAVESDEMPSEEEMEQIVLDENAAEKAEMGEKPAKSKKKKEKEIPDILEQFVEPDEEGVDEEVVAEEPPTTEREEAVSQEELERREWQSSFDEQKKLNEQLLNEIRELKDRKPPD